MGLASNSLTQSAFKIERIQRSNARTTVTPFKVIKGHRFRYQSKANMRLHMAHISATRPPH